MLEVPMNDGDDLQDVEATEGEQRDVFSAASAPDLNQLGDEEQRVDEQT